MVKTCCKWMVLLLTVAVLGRSGVVFAQETKGFSSNTPYLAQPTLSASERKNIIKVAGSGSDENLPAGLKETPAENPAPKPEMNATDPVKSVSRTQALAKDASVSVSSIETQKVGLRNPVSTIRGDTALDKKNDTSSNSWFFFKYLGSFMVVVGLIILMAWIYYRLSPMRRVSAGIVTVLSKTPVNSRQSIALVKVGSRLLVVGLSSGHMTTLDAISDPEEVALLLGRVERENAYSISSLNTFKGLFKQEERAYEGADEDTIVDDYDEAGRPAWQDAREELAGLYNKVKGLARIRSK